MLAGIISAAVSVVGAISKIGLVISALKVLGNALMAIGKALGIIKPETKVDELGDKAIQSELNPNDFDSYEKYVKAVETFEVDPEKSKMIPEKEKIEKGIELATGVAVEKFPNLPVEQFFTLVGEKSEYFTVEKMEELAKVLVNDPDKMGDITGFINGTEKDFDVIENVVSLLTNVEKSVNPQTSDENARTAAMNLRD